jgi:hypothetical protein
LPLSVTNWALGNEDVWGSGGIVPTFLISNLEVQWWDWRHDRFSPMVSQSVKRLGGSQSWCGHCGEEKNLLPYQGSKTSSLPHIPSLCRYADWATPAPNIVSLVTRIYRKCIEILTYKNVHKLKSHQNRTSWYRCAKRDIWNWAVITNACFHSSPKSLQMKYRSTLLKLTINIFQIIAC